MSNSPLVSYTKISPNHSNGRKYPITKITPHYVAGNCTVETLGEIFAPTSRQASSNYGIGSDGRVGMYVEEKDRAGTSGNADNDNRAITIEVSNLKDKSVTPEAWKSLVNLCVDICKRNNIDRLNGTGDKSGNLTVHRGFQDTDCPGEGLYARMPQLAQEVNAILHPTKPHGVREAAGWKYIHSDNSFTRNDGEKIDNKGYHFDKNGIMQTGGLLDDKKGYYLHEIHDANLGMMESSTVIPYKGHGCVLKSDGSMYADTMIGIDENGYLEIK